MDIYQRYGPAIMRKCLRLLGNNADAEDVVQGLFTDLLAAGKTEVDLPYLYRAATNRCLNQLRDKKRRARLLSIHQKAVRPSGPTGADERLNSRETLELLVSRLDAKSREILVYRYFDRMGQEEIARVCGFSRKTIGKRLAKIAAALDELGQKGAVR